ncbi:MAG: sulfatase [Bryobacterales bacterium]|nr:sulfatase [Bryobacterales bacterium]
MRKLALLVCLGAAATAVAADRPNVLFIAVDDLNDWIEPLGGHPQAKTPNFARLARQSTLFARAYTASPSCNPSRAALMTGVAPYRSGVYSNNQAWRPAMPDAVTIPQAFRRNGYWAGGSGKIYHGVYPDPQSWDEYWPSKRVQREQDPVPAVRPANGIQGTGNFDWGPLSVASEEMSDAKVVDWVIERLHDPHDKPFFLACGIFRPHLPWYVPERYFLRFPIDSVQLPPMFDGDLADVPQAGVRMARPERDHARVVEHGQWKRAVQAYLASISFVDGLLGRVLDAIDESGHAANTIIVLWGDHGWHLGEKRHWRKFALWEEATRVPLFFAAPPGTPGLPEGTKPGVVSHRPVSLMDVYPTLLDLAGLGSGEGLDGRSLVPLLRDPEAAWTPAVITYRRMNHAVRSDDYRYIRYADGSEELYDHRVDPMEWTNLAGDEKYAGAKESLARWLPDVNAPEAPEQPSDRRTNEVAVPE